MSKYLKLFETTSQYEAYMGGGEKILPNVSLIEETNKVEYNPYMPERYIIYKSSEKLNKTWSDETAIFGTTIKSHTFENGIGTIEFNDNVTSIGNETFQNCSSLTSITIPNSVTSIGHRAFQYCSGLTNITIPDSVTSIGNQVFQNCSSLTSINIPNGVTSIGMYAFNNCSSLTSVTIGNSVTSIDKDAFSYCTNLTSVTIPNSVFSIGQWAFNGCTKLTSVTVEVSAPPSLGSGAFANNASGRKIYVPASSIYPYKGRWSEYASDIEAIPAA